MDRTTPTVRLTHLKTLDTVAFLFKTKWRLFVYVCAPVLLSIASMAFFGIFSAQSFWQDHADVIFSHTKIYTSVHYLPSAEAMAVKQGRIIKIGSVRDVEVTAGPKTLRINLQGKSIVPGFIDSHLHLISGGLQMAQVDLRDAGSPAEFIEKVQLFVQGLQKRTGDWVIGGGWNNEKWGGELPQASWIDNITRHFPVWLYRIDGHMGLANTVAMDFSDVCVNAVHLEGGNIIKDGHGAPSGIFVDSAMKLIIDNIPEPSIHERRQALIRASRHALSHGITSVVDFGRFFPGSGTTRIWDDFHEVHKWADQMGNILVRIYAFLPLETWPRVFDTFRASGYKISDHLQVGGVKGFADGSLGSSTALFNKPYADNSNNNGLQVTSQDSILENVVEADHRKLQVAIHAIGDAANDQILDAFEELCNLCGQRDRRLRIEHAQHLSQKAIPRFHLLDVIASMQPSHLLDDAEFASRKLGVERSMQQSYLLKSLLDNGTRLAFGSDWPVASISPLVGMRAAVKRTPHGFNGPWMPSESISVESALQGYTCSAAYASFRDDDIGSLSAGKLADFVVLSGDFYEDFEQVHVLATYVGGMELFTKHEK